MNQNQTSPEAFGQRDSTLHQPKCLWVAVAPLAILAWFLGSLTLSAAEPAPVATKKMNVLFIAVDDLKPLLGCYGDSHVISPNFDRLAKSGTTFLNAHCQQAVCGPSRASLMTGLRPDTTRVYDLKTQFRSVLPDVVTIPQHFRSQGYTSIGMGKIFDPRSTDSKKAMDAVSWSEPYMHPQSPSGSSMGYLAPATVGKIRAAQVAGIKGHDKLMAAIGKPTTDSAPVPDNSYSDGAIAERAVGMIRKLSKSEDPFFLAVGFRKPHLPFNAPQKYWDLYERDALPMAQFTDMPADAPAIGFQDSWELRSYDAPKNGAIPEPLQRELIHGYYACVSFIDAQLGKVLDELEASEAADNTIIILWGDHGWHLGDHGMWCKHTNFEQATRSPLILAAPGVGKTENQSNSPVEFVDIFPTLCELAGIASPAGLHGQSLVPVMDDGTTSVKPVAISQYPRRQGKDNVMGYALRDQRYRYIEWRVCDDGRSPGTGEAVVTELYDYQSDPLETRNVIHDPAYAAIVTEMETLMRELEVGKSAKSQNGKPPVAIDSRSMTTISRPTASDAQLSIQGSSGDGEVSDDASLVQTRNQDDMSDIVVRDDEFLVSSNLWGARLMKGDVPDFQFELGRSSVANGNSQTPPSWTWVIEDDFSAPIFPYLGYGDRMWARQAKSTTNRLPVQLKDLKSCDFHYDLKIDELAMRKSKGNLALDVWLGETETNNPSQTRTEIMLWFDRQDQYPIGAKNPQGIYEFGGAKWELFTGELGNSGTQVCTFIAQSPVYSGVVDFMIPLSIVQEKGFISETTYLGAFEAGNEIYRGNGSTEFKKFFVDIRQKGFPADAPSHAVTFDDEPSGKQWFDGKEGAKISFENTKATSSRTVVARFAPNDLVRRQVVYKEGGGKNGMSIVIEDATLYFTHWHAADKKVKRTVIGHAIGNTAAHGGKPEKNHKTGSSAKRKFSKPSRYLVTTLRVSEEGRAMEAFVDGKSVGSGEFFGLSAKRGSSTLGWSDEMIKYHKKMSDDPCYFSGVVDEFFIFDRALEDSEIHAAQ